MDDAMDGEGDEESSLVDQEGDEESAGAPASPAALPLVGGAEEQEEFECRGVTPAQRRRFCLLALSLAQSTDEPLPALVERLTTARGSGASTGAPLPLRLLSAWRRHLGHILQVWLFHTHPSFPKNVWCEAQKNEFFLIRRTSVD